MATQPVAARESLAPLTHARAMYFGYYMAIGAFIPFINLYYERMGLNGVEIGSLVAMPVLLTSSTALFWGGVADAFRWHHRILRLALMLTPAAVLMLSQATRYVVLIPFVIAYGLFSSPILPLLDSAALEAAEAGRRTYGDLRLWGTMGWSISTWVMGTLIEKLSIRLLFYGYAVFMALTFVLSLFQPPRRRFLRSSLGHGLRQLLFRRDFLAFLLSIFLVAMTGGAVNSFLSLYLDGIGASEGVIGLAWMVASVSEIPVMLYSGPILRRVGARGLLKVAFATYALRWLLFGFITDPAWVLPMQFLHGLSFGAFLVGGVTYVNQRTPEGMSTTAQAIFSTVAFGLASIAGSLMGGYFYDKVGMATLFRVLSLIAAAGFGVFWLIRESPPGVSLSPGRPLS